MKAGSREGGDRGGDGGVASLAVGGRSTPAGQGRCGIHMIHETVWTSPPPLTPHQPRGSHPMSPSNTASRPHTDIVPAKPSPPSPPSPAIPPSQRRLLDISMELHNLMARQSVLQRKRTPNTEELAGVEARITALRDEREDAVQAVEAESLLRGIANTNTSSPTTTGQDQPEQTSQPSKANGSLPARYAS